MGAGIVRRVAREPRSGRAPIRPAWSHQLGSTVSNMSREQILKLTSLASCAG